MNQVFVAEPISLERPARRKVQPDGGWTIYTHRLIGTGRGGPHPQLRSRGASRYDTHRYIAQPSGAAWLDSFSEDA